MTIKRLLIANRGEIAVRIIRACKESGIESVQVYSEADAESLAVQMADTSICIGPGPANQSYLCSDKIIEAAIETRADAIHPGYGFFSENAEFAQAVADSRLIFVGPDAATIKKMGNKIQAIATAKSAGVPTVPGSEGEVEGVKQVKTLAEQIGFPLMIKASAGGGGRGIRVVHSMQELEQQVPQASTEALAAFGDGSLYVEKFVQRGRHIEVQILGDGDKVLHFFERECSLQRRRQKVWEEAPACMIPDSAREALCQAAVNLALAVNYQGAGTVEFLYDSDTEAFYFLEMNTRIQVEHPVTEMITGVDLVREMIKVAAGKKLTLQQSEIHSLGHAIEVRINAEDPAMEFMPFPGTIEALQVPTGPGVRFDTLMSQGYSIPPFYDSLLGKLIVWDQDRTNAISRMQRALSELKIEGVNTTAPMHQCLTQEPDVQSGQFDTLWLENWLPNNTNKLGARQ